MAISDQQLNLVTKLYAILRLMADVFLEIIVLVLVSPSTVCPERWRILKQSLTRYLVQDVLNGGDQWGVLAESSHQRSQTWGSFDPSGICAQPLPLLWSALVRYVLVRLLSWNPGLFSGHQTSSPYILIHFGMLPGNSPQVHKCRRDVVGESLD